MKVNELVPLYRPWFNTLIPRSHKSRMTALRLYRCRRSIRDRDYEYDRGISEVKREAGEMHLGPQTWIDE